jgi:AraC-like DNA-binding protein
MLGRAMKANVGNPRGILNRKQGEEKFRLSLHPSAPDLAFFVEHYWIVTWDLSGQEPYQSETLPHPSVHLVVENDKSSIVGVMHGKFSRTLEGRGWAFGIKFRPGAFYPFLKSPVSRLTDRSLAPRAVFGADGVRLEEEMRRCEDEGAMLERADSFLRERLPERDEHVALVNQVIDRIIADRAITKVDDVARLLDLTTRSLQRLFSHYVGVSPKWVIKRYRLHDAAERLADGDVPDWPQLALDLGYFDQAHFINDFNAIVGKAPAEYAKAETSRDNSGRHMTGSE